MEDIKSATIGSPSSEIPILAHRSLTCKHKDLASKDTSNIIAWQMRALSDNSQLEKANLRAAGPMTCEVL